MSSEEPTPQLPTGHDPEGRGVTGEGRLARLPALDGLRGIGLPMVMLYHHGQALFGWLFHGSILCVSMFFTLSGFLITRLLLQEHDQHGRISLRRFYTRRIRRLMPAALTVATLIALVWTVYPSGSRGLDFAAFFWAIFYGTNLMLLFRGSSYQNLFAEQSPLQHTWSLSLEEQIYIVFPLVLIGILYFTRLRRAAAALVVGLAVASFAAAWMWAEFRGGSRPYYATEARAGEFLVGAAMAVFWARSPMVPRLTALIRSRLGTVVGLLVLVVDLWLWIVVGLDNHFLFRGATALNAALVAVLMAYACAAPRTGASRILSVKPLVLVGQRAYTLYLVHWPVFVLLSPDATGLASIPLLIVRFAVSAAVGEVIYRFVEAPILRERIWPGGRLFRGCALLAIGGLTVATFAPTSAINRLLDPEALALQQQLLANLPQITDADPTRAAGSDTLPARVLVVGDSQAWFVGTGMVQMWGEANGVHIEYSAGVGCGTTELTALEYLGERFEEGRPGCFEWSDNLPRVIARFRPQVVVVAGGLANISDHEIDGRPQHIGQPEYDAWLLQQMRDFAAQMAASGAQVLWLTNPDVDVPNPPGVSAFPEEDPTRMSRYNELIEQLADELDTVDAADVAGLVKARPGGQFDPVFRPDGAHMLLTEAPDLVAFLADAIVEATSHVA